MKLLSARFVPVFVIAVLIAALPCVAAVTTITIIPSQVPDEQIPRVNVGDSPAGFEDDSWQGPWSGKSNWHARYLADGDYLSAMLPADAATLTIADLADLSYFTKRPTGTPAGRDWWMQIYTRPTGAGDCAGWYHRRYINNYQDHANIGSWTQQSTSSGMTFRENSCAPTAPMTLAQLIAADGGDLVMMFSMQTDSGWNGFDGYLDGLVVTLTNGNVGRVNFEAPAGRTTIEIEANPWQVPDEEYPRINVGDYPSSFAVDSWQGPLIGKTNWHAAYLPATPPASFLSHLFPVDAPTLTIGDLASVNYFTKRPAATPAGRDWWVQIYTRPTGVGDCASWYHRRYINNYQDHTDIGNWVEYSTNSGMTFRENKCINTAPMTLAELIAADGDDLILMFSVQTNSGWNGYDGFLDGLQVTLNNGNIGQVNFEAVKGLYARFMFEAADPLMSLDENERDRFTFGVSWFPIQLLETRARFRINRDIPQRVEANANELLFELHGFL